MSLWICRDTLSFVEPAKTISVTIIFIYKNYIDRDISFTKPLHATAEIPSF